MVFMFIVIEGIDGAGCQSQAELLAKHLTKKHLKNTYLKFPHYDTPVGAMIKDFLYERKHLSPSEQFLLYSLQFVSDRETIERKTKENGIVVADRYFTTTLCYQTLEGVKEKTALRFAKDFGIIVPDIVFFLDVAVPTAITWKRGEKKKMNFREKDKQFMQKSYDKYRDLAKRKVWTKWVKIDGERSKQAVHRDIIKVILKKYEK